MVYVVIYELWLLHTINLSTPCFEVQLRNMELSTGGGVDELLWGDFCGIINSGTIYQYYPLADITCWQGFFRNFYGEVTKN